MLTWSSYCAGSDAHECSCLFPLRQVQPCDGLCVGRHVWFWAGEKSGERSCEQLVQQGWTVMHRLVTVWQVRDEKNMPRDISVYDYVYKK